MSVNRTPIRSHDLSINFATGCTRYSRGCDICFAERMTHRWGGSFEPRFHPERVEELRRVRPPAGLGRRARVLTCTMGDAFHEAFLDAELFAALDAMAANRALDFTLLTKRAHRMRLVIGRWLHARALDAVPAHMWPGVSIEEEEVVGRADHLRAIPTAGPRVIFAEPLLTALPSLDLTDIHWLVIGGESGPGYREMQDEWAQDLLDRCAERGVSGFFKQHCGPRPETGPQLRGRRIEQAPVVCGDGTIAVAPAFAWMPMASRTTSVTGGEAEDRMEHPRVETAAQLMASHVAAPEFAVEDLVPFGGVTVLAGRPKARKSWLALDIAVGVATGTAVLRELACPVTAPVLYLALEDSRYRMQSRLRELLLGEPAPELLTIAYRSERDFAGMMELERWARGHPGGMIVVDVVAKFMNLGGTYASEYGSLGALNDLARATGTAIILVTHTTKSGHTKDDPLAAVRGSAISAATDAVLVLEKQTENIRTLGQMMAMFGGEGREEMDSSALLYADGKDIANTTYRLRRDGQRFVIVENDVQLIGNMSEHEFDVLDALRQAHAEGHEALQRVEIEARCPRVPRNSMSGVMRALVDGGMAERCGRGRYRLQRHNERGEPTGSDALG